MSPGKTHGAKDIESQPRGPDLFIPFSGGEGSPGFTCASLIQNSIPRGGGAQKHVYPPSAGAQKSGVLFEKSHISPEIASYFLTTVKQDSSEY